VKSWSVLVNKGWYDVEALSGGGSLRKEIGGPEWQQWDDI